MNDSRFADRTEATGNEAHLIELVERISQQLQHGEAFSIDAFTREHPEHADDLRRMLPTIQAMAELGYSDVEAEAGRDNETAVPKALGDFRIIRELGRGGMGVVYEAEQISLGRVLALKVLPFAAVMDQRTITRFKNEARAAATLDHPNIVPVHSVGKERGVYYYAMALVEGRTLAAVIDQLQRHITRTDLGDRGFSIDEVASGREREVTEEILSRAEETCTAKTEFQSQTPHQRSEQDTRRDLQAAVSTHRHYFDSSYFDAATRLGLQAAEALEHAHQHGIVHRDIKPGNLMIDIHSKLWVADFGLARIESDAGMTMTGDLVGTLRYMSPEQALAKRVVVDHRADIYALGVTLYELLTLHQAFDGSNREELLRQIAFEDPKPLRHCNRAVPEDLQTIVLKAMAKNPNERYDSAQDMADDLQAVLDNKPITAQPPTIVQRAAKRAARHKPLVAAAAVVLVLTAIGLTATTLLVAQQRDRAQAAQREADRQKQAAQLAQQKEARQRLAAERQREQAQLQKRAAEQNFKRAREAVDRYLTQVSEHELLNAPALQPLRKDLLDLALEYYQEFIQERADDPSLRFELAEAYYRVGRIALELGSVPDALAAHGQGSDILEKLVVEEPAVSEYRAKLAKSCFALGVVHQRSGQTDEARSAYQQAIRIGAELASEKPGALQYRAELAKSYHNLAVLLKSLGQRDQAFALNQKALQIREQLTQQRKDPQDQLLLISSYNNLASFHFDSKQIAAAQRLFGNAVENGEALTRQHPERLEFQANLAMSYDNLALIHRELGQPDQGIELLEKAIAIRETLVRQNPLVPEYQNDLANCYLGLAGRYGRQDKAADLLRKAVEMREHLVRQYPEFTDYQSDLARAFNNLGVHHEARGQTDTAIELYEKAVEIRERLTREDPDVLSHKSNLALNSRNLAGLYKAAGKKDEASDLYQQAVRLGKELTQQGADRPQYWTDLADAYNNWAVLEARRETDLAINLFLQAAQTWKKLLQKHPEDPYRSRLVDVLANLAQVHSTQGHFDKSADVYAKAIDLQEGILRRRPHERHHQARSHRLFSRLGVAQYRAGRFQNAVKSLEQAVQREHDRAGNRIRGENRLVLAMAYWQSQQPENALRLYPPAAARIGTYPSVQTKRLLKEAEQLMGLTKSDRDRLIAQFFAETQLEEPRLFVERGRWRQSRGEHALAIEDFSLAIRNEPDSKDHLRWGCRGASYYTMRRDQEALVDLSKAIEFSDSRAWLWKWRGRVHQRLGQLESALADMSRAIELAPGDGQHYVDRAAIYRDSGKSDEALADLIKSVELEPFQAGTRRSLRIRAEVYRDLGRPQAAFADAERALQIRVGGDVFALRGSIYADQLQQYDRAVVEYSQAIEHYEQELERDPDNTRLAQLLRAAEAAIKEARKRASEQVSMPPGTP